MVKAAEGHRLRIFISEEIIGEISRVLEYPKLKQVYMTAGLRQRDLMEAVLNASRLVKVNERVGVVEEHPADDKFIECALAAGADYVVSGDRHLLSLASYKKTKMVSVSELLDILEAGKKSSNPPH